MFIFCRIEWVCLSFNKSQLVSFNLKSRTSLSNEASSADFGMAYDGLPTSDNENTQLKIKNRVLALTSITCNIRFEIEINRCINCQRRWLVHCYVDNHGDSVSWPLPPTRKWGIQNSSHVDSRRQVRNLLFEDFISFSPVSIYIKGFSTICPRFMIAQVAIYIRVVYRVITTHSVQS